MKRSIRWFTKEIISMFLIRITDTHPGFHVCEEILQLGESDLGGGHELLHDGQVPVPSGESLATVELHLPAAFLHASSQLSHVLLQLFHAEIGNSRHVYSLDLVNFLTELHSVKSACLSPVSLFLVIINNYY